MEPLGQAARDVEKSPIGFHLLSLDEFTRNSRNTQIFNESSFYKKSNLIFILLNF